MASGELVVTGGPVVGSGYQVMGLLQRGEDFDTYDAWSEQRFSRCVIKTIRADRPSRISSRARLLREGEILAGLTHPHLVRAYEVRRRRRPVVVLETVTGATLQHVLEQRGRMVWRDVAQLGLQLSSVLRYLHASGYLHLDVKPGNVIVEAGRIKLIDLSLAQPPGPCARGLGTAAYLAPEQARGEVVGEAADVWGVGVTLYEAATGDSPFRRGGHGGTAAGGTDTCSGCGRRAKYPQLAERAPAVRGRRRLPAQLATTIDATLEPAPADRPSMAELSGVLAGCA